MDKEESENFEENSLEWHKEQIRKSKLFLEKSVKELGLTLEDLAHLSTQKYPH